MRIKELDSLLQDKKSLKVTLGISLLYILPLLTADYTYLDDYGRDLFGYGWQHDGRFIATLLAKVWSLNSAVMSFHPFSLVLSASILGFTGYLLTAMMGLEENRIIKWSSLLVVTAPAFLGNLVYKFDCLPMALSLFVVVIPYIFFHNRIKFAIASFIGVFLALGLYQSSATVFFIVGSVFLIREMIQFEWKRFFASFSIIVASFLLAYISYMIALKVLNLDMSDRAGLIISEANFSELLTKNNDLFFQRISLLLRSGNYKYWVMLFLSFTVLGLGFFVYSAKEKLKGLLILPLLLIVLGVNFWLICGVSLLLVDTYWDLRTFCGLGFFLMVCVYFHKYIKVNAFQWLSRFSVALLVFFSFLLMAQFGKVLTRQTEFTKDFISEIRPYLKGKSLKNIVISGKMVIAPKNNFTYSQFPIFENLVQAPIGQYTSWSKEVMNINSELNSVNILQTDDYYCKGELLLESKFYYLRKLNSDTVIIDFRKSDCVK